MANYTKVVEMLGENLASFLELGKKILVDWKVDTRKVLSMLHNLRKADFIGLIEGTHEIREIILKVIHPDYKPIKMGIVITSRKRNRQEILSHSLYELGDVFKKEIYPYINGDQSEQEILREDEISKGKNFYDIKTEMCISGISPNQIAERLIQRTEDLKRSKGSTIIGYCSGLIVLTLPFIDGCIPVYAYNLNDRNYGSIILSCDI